MPILVQRNCEWCGGTGHMVSTRHEGDKVVISQWTCACVRIDLTPDEIEKVRAYLALNSVQI